MGDAVTYREWHDEVRSVTSPAANAEWSISPPGGEIWDILAFSFTFTTDATVANRAVQIALDDGVTVFFRAYGFNVQAATTVVPYSGATGQSGLGRNQIGAINWPTVPPRLYPGWRMRSITQSYAAGDQFSAIGINLCIGETTTPQIAAERQQQYEAGTMQPPYTWREGYA